MSDVSRTVIAAGSEWPTMRPEATLRHLPIAPAARENSSEGGIPVKAVRTHGRGGPEQLFFEDAPGKIVLQVAG